MPASTKRNSTRRTARGTSKSGTSSRRIYRIRGGLGSAAAASSSDYSLPNKTDATRTLKDAGLLAGGGLTAYLLSNVINRPKASIILSVLALFGAVMTPKQHRTLKLALTGVAVGAATKSIASGLNLNGVSGLNGLGKTMRGIGRFFGLGTSEPHSTEPILKASEMAGGFVDHEPRVVEAEWREVKD